MNREKIEYMYHDCRMSLEEQGLQNTCFSCYEEYAISQPKSNPRWYAGLQEPKRFPRLLLYKLMNTGTLVNMKQVTLIYLYWKINKQHFQRNINAQCQTWNAQSKNINFKSKVTNL